MSAANESAQKLLVSIIIPTFNRRDYITFAVESVLAQDVAPIEIIVVDDGSTDDTRNVLEPFLSAIRYIRQDNAGVAAARNRGVRAAGVNIFVFLIATMCGSLGSSEHSLRFRRLMTCFVFEGVEWFVDRPRDEHLLARSASVKWPRCDVGGYIIDPVLDVADGRYLTLCTLLCTKRAFLDVGFFEETLCLGEDEDWLSRASMRKRFFYSPTSYLQIRLHDNQTGQQREACIRSQISVFEKIRVRTRKVNAPASAAVTKRLAAKWSHLANNLAKEKRFDEALRAA